MQVGSRQTPNRCTHAGGSSCSWYSLQTLHAFGLVLCCIGGAPALALGLCRLQCDSCLRPQLLKLLQGVQREWVLKELATDWTQQQI